MKYSRRLFVFGIVLAILAIACSSSATPETTINTAVPAATKTATSELTKDIIGKVGDTITQGDYIITLVGIETAASYGDIYKAADGKIFVAVEIIVESGADTGVSVNPMYCKLTDGDAYSYTITFGGKDPFLSSQNDLPKGEKMRGWLTFEVPETAKDFIFSYEPLSVTETIRIRFSLGI
jgi:azurin